MNAWSLVTNGLPLGVLSAALILVVPGARAQNAAQMEYERQQREYWRAQEQQREADRQRQQLMNENQRRGQSELNQWTQPAPGQSYGGAPGATGPGATGGGAGAPDLRAVWQRRPPLPADRKPLLGRWNPRGAAAADLGAASEAAQMFGAQAAEMARALVGGMTQGACDSMFGCGFLEFRPKALVSLGSDGSESVLNRVEYRGGGNRVVVLPQEPASVGALVFDFERPDRIKAAGLGCVMKRATPDGHAAGTGAALVSRVEATAPSTARAGTLHVTAGIAEPSGQVAPVSGRDIWVLRESIDGALMRAGFPASSDGSVLRNFGSACRQGLPICRQGMQAIAAARIGIVRTDADGHARTAALPVGRYHVFGDFVHNQRSMMWNLPVDVRSGDNELGLDLRNARALQ